MKSSQRFGVLLLATVCTAAAFLYQSFILHALRDFSASRYLWPTSIQFNGPPTVTRDLSSELLDAPLPRINFTQYAALPPHNINSTERRFAYATLLCTREPDERDPFFAAAQSLVWRLLWSDWHSQYPVIVFVCPATPRYQRRILAGQGAIIEEIELISGVIEASQLHLSRWRDQLTKLNMWRYTRYERITFMDVDAFPIRNIDDLFTLVPTQHCLADRMSIEDAATMQASREEADALCEYTFGGTIMSSQEGALNGGVFVFAPSTTWHEKLMRDLRKTNEYDVRTAEQGLLDSSLGFGRNGPFPWHDFSQIYNADQEVYEAHKFTDDLKVLHFKLWSPWSLLFAPELNTRWDVDWMAMCRWYDSETFIEARLTGHRKEPLEVFLENEARKEAQQGKQK